MLKQDLPFNYFFENGNFVTRYSQSIIDSILVEERYSSQSNLSYSSQSMIERFNAFYEGSHPMISVWSDETLINVILSDRSYLEREIKNRDIVGIEDLDGDDLLFVYFGRKPTREDLCDLIYSMIDTEYHLENNEFPIGYLMAGLFYFQDWLRYNEQDVWQKNKGNFQYLNADDINKLKVLYGLSQDSSDIEVMMTISNEQNLIIYEISTKEGLDEDNIEILSKIIQRFM